MKKVKVYDAIMGSGKTYNAIERMKRSKSNFLYVTPFLEEVNRIIENVPGTKQPKVTSEYNTSGEFEPLYKRDNLLRMANKKINLATTHSLFSKLHRSDYKHFQNYDLILDEVLTPIEVLKMPKDDIMIAFREGLLVLNKITREVSFTGDSYKGSLYAHLKKFCDTANVIFVNNRLLVWAFPPEIFRSFKSVSVLTYSFEGSLLSHYFKYYNIPFKEIKNNSTNEALIKDNIRKQLNIYEGSCNKLGENYYAFSVNWLKNRSPHDFRRIKTTVANLLGRKFKTSSKDTGFTTFKEYSSRLKGKGFSTGFIAVNERATNRYANKKTMIYLANRFLNPNIIDYFRSGDVEVNEENWALAELLQWIWRGQIREGKHMNVFIPSKRMRLLLYKWLNNGVSSKLDVAA